jgi:hypothetical protein
MGQRNDGCTALLSSVRADWHAQGPHQPRIIHHLPLLYYALRPLRAPRSDGVVYMYTRGKGLAVDVDVDVGALCLPVHTPSIRFGA